MKRARVIIYGWVIAFFLLFAGVGTMEWGNWITGGLLCVPFLVFSLLMDKYKAAIDKELDEIEEWIDKVFKFIG